MSPYKHRFVRLLSDGTLVWADAPGDETHGTVGLEGTELKGISDSSSHETAAMTDLAFGPQSIEIAQTISPMATTHTTPKKSTIID